MLMIILQQTSAIIEIHQQFIYSLIEIQRNNLIIIHLFRIQK